MKTLITTTAALLVAGTAVSTAQAQSYQTPVYPQGYVGGDAMFWDLDPDNGPSRDDVGLRLRGGAQFNDYFALEGHLGAGGSDGPAELEYVVGAFAKGILPVADEFRLYGLAGVSEVDFDLDRTSGFSYGGGAEFDLTPSLALGADYVRYLDKSDYTFDAASVGLRYRF